MKKQNLRFPKRGNYVLNMWFDDYLARGKRL